VNKNNQILVILKEKLYLCVMQITKVDISKYRQMTNTPAGAIMLHILRRMGMTQKKLSILAGICPQHINALIKGSRRFSPESSLAIEDALCLDSDGLFYACQCNYDVTLAKRERQKKPNIKKLRKSTFWDVDLEKVDWHKGKRWAISRVLEYGCLDDFIEISKLYGRQSFVSELAKSQNVFEPNVMRNASTFGLL